MLWKVTTENAMTLPGNRKAFETWCRKHQNDNGLWIVMRDYNSIEPVNVAFPAGVGNSAVEFHYILRTDVESAFAIRVNNPAVLFGGNLVIHNGGALIKLNVVEKTFNSQYIDIPERVSIQPCKRQGCDTKINRWVPWSMLDPDLGYYVAQ